ncbi:protein adenylyltransferase SelO [Reinekea sp.]|uniref:protein adenylyltransferase SelO n=2 Tax=Reinekea sp. TaxID=1970455 RepID=UPI003988BE7D
MLQQRYIDKQAGPFSKVTPSLLKAPYWVAFNTELAEQIDFPHPASDNLLAVFSGQAILKDTQPIAQKYAGHQFGGWNPDLGDGRGLLLGEWLDNNQQHWEFHLKGAGKTPYSRFGDGRAVLRSSIREYLGSEALHALGIASTRALALVGSAESVVRESVEPGATLLRVTQSHVRFGHFEWLAYKQDLAGLKHLAQYTIEQHYPDCQEQPDPFAALFDAVAQQTAVMIGQWMAYGFVHGVMNTDNMSILGETFDYGPYAFIEQTKMNAVFNHTDQNGRYAFDEQPSVGLWNLQRLAHAFSALVPSETLKASLERYAPTCDSTYYGILSKRLGGSFSQPIPPAICLQWVQLLANNKLDYHWYFRQLSGLTLDQWASLADEFIDREGYLAWVKAVQPYLIQDDQQRTKQMLAANPVTIARNAHLQTVIDLAYKGDFEPFHSLCAALMSPFEEQPHWSQWQQKPVLDDRQIVLSCSS